MWGDAKHQVSREKGLGFWWNLDSGHASRVAASALGPTALLRLLVLAGGLLAGGTCTGHGVALSSFLLPEMTWHNVKPGGDAGTGLGGV